MQKKIIALAVAALASGAAFAQSANVTIYGSMDMGFSHRSDNVDSGIKSKNSIDDGLAAASRLGFRGTEDLGNGWSVLFNLETGFAADTGNLRQSNRIFGRQAHLGMTNSNVGTFLAGRLYTPHYSFISNIDPFRAGTVGMYRNVFAAGVTTGGENLFDPTRVDNAVAYVSPSFSGFNITAAYSNNAIGQENLENKSDNRVFALLPRYTNGPLDIGFSYHQIKNKNGSVFGVDEKPKITNWLIGGAYDFGALKLHAFYDQNKLTSRDNVVDGKTLKSFLLGITVPFDKHAIQASYTQGKLKEASGAKTYKAHQWALGYTYSLSKRTGFYAAISDINNKKYRAAKASVGDNSNGGEGYQTGVQFGLRHSF
ncbi:MAG: porin [Betaproteobacteria bacterium]|nr:porin [Betaproteobacteria bacterium]